MNKLRSGERARILHLLCESSPIRAVTRLTGASKKTVTKLLVDAGKACWRYHDQHVCSVSAKRIQCDEIWSFTYAKAKNVPTAKGTPSQAGDTWTWTALDADSKLIVSYLVGGRDSGYAHEFMQDVTGRLATGACSSSRTATRRIWKPLKARSAATWTMQLVKLYGAVPESVEGRYSPMERIGACKVPVEGKPRSAYVSTSYVERENLTMRMHMRRFTRPTNAFSKKVENHAHAVALHMMYNNFVRIRPKLRMPPAMAAGVSDRLWEIGDIVALVEAAEAQETPKVRGPYQKKAA